MRSTLGMAFDLHGGAAAVRHTARSRHRRAPHRWAPPGWCSRLSGTCHRPGAELSTNLSPDGPGDVHGDRDALCEAPSQSSGSQPEAIGPLLMGRIRWTQEQPDAGLLRARYSARTCCAAEPSRRRESQRPMIGEAQAAALALATGCGGCPWLVRPWWAVRSPCPHRSRPGWHGRRASPRPEGSGCAAPSQRLDGLGNDLRLYGQRL